MANGENNIPDVPNESNNSAGQNVEQMLSNVGQVNNKTELDINDYLPVLPTDSDVVPEDPLLDLTPDQKADLAAENFSLGAQNLMRSNVDPLAGAKDTFFGKDDYQYDRYAAYGSSIMDELGFTPYRDNETYYNAHTSTWDDFKRSIGPTFSNTWLAFHSNLPFGTTDATAQEHAKKMAKNSEIASSSKEGLGAFGVNLFHQTGYTMGIMAEIVAEEAIMVAGTLLTRGATAELTAVRTAANAARLAKAGASATKNLANTLKNIRTISKRLDDISDVNKAKTFYDRAVKGVGNFLNPFDETSKYIRNYDKLDGLSNMAKTAKGFGSFYKDTRSVRMAFSESALEGGFVKNEMRQKMLEDWYSKHPGEEISNEALAEIDYMADAAGKSTFALNMPTIFFSNKIVFDNMFKSLSPMRRLADDVVETGVKGEIRFTRKAAKDAYQYVGKGLQRRWNNIKNPAEWARSSGKYFKANFSEGFQEIAQESIAGGVERYYESMYEGDALQGGLLAGLSQGFSKQISAEGFEVFMSGFLMGGMVQPVSMIPGAVQKHAGRLTAEGRKKYNKQKAAREEYITNTVNQLNDMWNNNKDYFMNDLADLVEAAKLSKGIDKASKSGDVKLLKDLQDRNNFNAMTTALKMGRMKNYRDQLDLYRNYSEEEIRSEFGMSKSDFLLGLDQAQTRMNKLEQRYDAIQKQFENPYNPNKYKIGSPQWQAEYRARTGWEGAQKEMLFKGYAFDRALERMDSVIRTAKDTAGLGKMNAADFNTLFSASDLQSTIDSLQAEVDSYGEVSDPEVAKNKVASQAKLNALRNFQEKFDSMLDNLGLSEATAEDVAATAAAATELTEEERRIDELARHVEEFSKEVEEGTPIAFDNEEDSKFYGANMDAINARIKELRAKAEKAKEGEKETDTLTDEQRYQEAYQAFSDYIRLMAKQSGDFVFNDKLEDAFDALVDFQRLDSDAKSLTTAINIMLDAGAFTNLADRLTRMQEDQDKNKKYEMEKALRAWLKEVKDPNDLINAFTDAGIFLDPKDLKMMMADGMSANDVTFYNMKTKEEILLTDPLYATAVKLILDGGGILTDINISEAEVPNSEVGYRLRNRYKDPDDNRTYNDIAEQYGFDPSEASTTLSLKDVLQKIIDSKFSTEHEKALAARLMDLAKDGETVTFVRNAKEPGSYNDVTQSVIDARYSSAEYDNGYLPFEASILHTEINRRVDSAYDTDREFRVKIDQLFNQVKEAVKDNEEFKEEAELLKSVTDSKEFMAMAMTNGQFQLLLSKIKSESNEKSMWANFIDAFIKWFTTSTSGIDNTVLNTTIETITTKIDPTIYTGTGPAATATTEFEVIPGDHRRVHSIARKNVQGESLTAEEKELKGRYPVLFARLVEVENNRKEALEKAEEEAKAMRDDAELTPENFETNLIGQQRVLSFITTDKEYRPTAEIKEAYVDQNGNYVIIAEKTSGPDGRTSTEPGKIYNMEVNPETGDIISFTTPDGNKGGLETLGDNFTGATLELQSDDFVRLKETGEYKPSQNQKNFETIQERLDNDEVVEGNILSPSEVRDEGTANKHADTTMYVQIEGVGPVKVYFPDGAPESGADVALSLELPTEGGENVIEDEDGNLVFQFKTDGPTYPAIIKVKTKDGEFSGNLAYTNYTEGAEFGAPDAFLGINQQYDKMVDDILDSMAKKPDTGTVVTGGVQIDTSLEELAKKHSNLLESYFLLVLAKLKNNSALRAKYAPLYNALALNNHADIIADQDGLGTAFKELIQEFAEDIVPLIEKYNKTLTGTVAQPIDTEEFNRYSQEIENKKNSDQDLEELKDNIQNSNTLTVEQQSDLLNQIEDALEAMKDNNIPTLEQLENLKVGDPIAIERNGNWISAIVTKVTGRQLRAEDEDGKEYTANFSSPEKININPLDSLANINPDNADVSDASMNQTDSAEIDNLLKTVDPEQIDNLIKEEEEGLDDWLNNCN